MKKNIKMTAVSVVLAATMIFMTGCGSASDSPNYKAAATENYAASESFASYDYAEEAYVDEAYAEAPASGSESDIAVNDTSRKLIKDVSLSIETEDLSVMVPGIENRVSQYGGYIESSYIYNGSDNAYDHKSASIVARVPASKLDEFLDNVAEVSNVVSKRVNVTDVTLEYVDTEARKDSLKAQQKRLIELVENAESVEDIIYIEDRLSNVEYELDSTERQIRSFDNKVDYSTVNLDVTEVKEYTPVEPKSRFEKMTEGFVDSLESIGNGILDFFVGLIVALPYLVLWGIIIFIIVIIIRAIVKKSKKNKAKKLEEMRAKQLAIIQAQANQAAAANSTISESQEDKKENE